MYEVTFGDSDVVFRGYEDDCWNFIVGFTGIDMRGKGIYSVEEFNGCWSDYGTINIERV